MVSSSETKLTGVPRTMLMTTRARVEEHQRADGIFHDPVVAEWWRSLPWDSELDRFYTPLAQLSWAVRAHIFDQMTQRHLAAHPDAVVVELGAGLSTRYHRIGQTCRTWIDLDLPDVTALRQQLDAATEHHRFLSQSVMAFDWMDTLPSGPPTSLLIMAEGLLMYFEASQVQALINQLKQRFPGATFVLDVVGGTTKNQGAKQLAQLNAPLKWFVKNEQDVAAMGLSLVQVRSLIQENCRYPDRIGVYRWVPWLSKLPTIRNASLILETTLNPLP
ncbi:MAG: class I SAM-dependent methyltransferase [Cyanobacteria bacterium P01_F01_bin.150]